MRRLAFIQEKQMIFSTYQFIFLFLPVTFFVYFLLNRFRYYSIAKIWLVLTSLYFYGQGSPDFFPFFLGSVVGNYVVGTCLVRMDGEQKTQRKLLLLIGILANVGLLGYYKYTDFFIENWNFLSGSDYALKHIVLPIGISFFTFQLIAFLVDSYRGETKEYDMINYLLFITFFPQLIVGPIIHHAEVVPQFEDEKNLKLNPEHVAAGLFLFSIGCAKKILLADPLTTDAQAFFGNITDALPMIGSWFHSIEYTVSYYFDLSGYADMAIGLGMMFNIVIPHNFDSPYKARNFQDYWRRWHMTLSRFLSNYIFRSVYKKGTKWRNYYVATMATFFVSGFWHGAGWTFVVWGIVNGFFVCTASWMKRRGKHFPAPAAYLLTALGVVAARVLFVANTFTDAWNVYRGMLNVSSLEHSVYGILRQGWGFVKGNGRCTVLLLIGLFICWFLPNSKTMQEKFRPTWKSALYAAILLIACITQMNQIVQFLYFQF